MCVVPLLLGYEMHLPAPCAVLPGLLAGWLLIFGSVGCWLASFCAVEFGWLVGTLIRWLVVTLSVGWLACISVCAHVL